ncbi:MAG: SDR family oxidoreductase [Gemmatimonadales bacterium]|nr:SDR family oxidoreductase [Gemmatimonadales bacterium]
MTITTDPVLSGKVALVTGANRGIGRAVAKTLAVHGAKVAVHFRSDSAKSQEVLTQLEGTGHVALEADLGDPEAASGLADRAVAELGRLDILVNNAGIYDLHDIAELPTERWREIWDRIIAVNLSGPAHVIQGAVSHLTAAGGGHIVNITSRGAFRGEPQAPAYGASKAGLNSLSQSLALALAPRGIHVVAVAPGWVLTDMTRDHLGGQGGDEIRSQSPLGRTALPQEVAQVVLLAVSGRADAITGSIIDVNCASYLRS